jgi:prepilin peptidase CpaA
MNVLHHLAALPVVAGLLLLVAAALHDVAARTVPNAMSAMIAVAGFVARLMDQRLALGLGVCVAVFLAAAICWRRGWMGGGDVKLLAAVALLVPPSSVGPLLLDVALAGGVLAIAYLVLRALVPSPPLRRRRPRSFPARVLRAEQWRIHRNCPLPYASAIAAGAFVCLLIG